MTLLSEERVFFYCPKDAAIVINHRPFNLLQYFVIGADSLFLTLLIDNRFDKFATVE
jgi:hypothetical protein